MTGKWKTEVRQQEDCVSVGPWYHQEGSIPYSISTESILVYPPGLILSILGVTYKKRIIKAIRKSDKICYKKNRKIKFGKIEWDLNDLFYEARRHQ